MMSRCFRMDKWRLAVTVVLNVRFVAIITLIVNYFSLL